MRRTMERSQRVEQRQKRWSWGGLSTDSEGRTGTDPLSATWKCWNCSSDSHSAAAVLTSRRIICDQRASVGWQFACEWGVEGSVCVPPALFLCRAPAGDVLISCARCRRGSPQAPGVTGSRRLLYRSLLPSLASRGGSRPCSRTPLKVTFPPLQETLMAASRPP